MRAGELRAAWVYRPTGKRWQGWESAPWDDPPDRVIRYVSEVATDLYLDDVRFVSGVRHAGALRVEPSPGVVVSGGQGVVFEPGPVLAVAVGTMADHASCADAGAWIGFRYDAVTGSDAFWTVPLGSAPVRVEGAARVWLRSDGRAYLVGPVSPASR